MTDWLQHVHDPGAPSAEELEPRTHGQVGLRGAVVAAQQQQTCVQGRRSNEAVVDGTAGDSGCREPRKDGCAELGIEVCWGREVRLSISRRASDGVLRIGAGRRVRTE